MKKLLQLIRLVLKCGKIGKAESNSAVGDTSTLISMAVGLAAVVGMFLAGQYAATHTAVLGNADMIFTTVLTVAAIAAFMMTLMNAINQLYISSDLDVLVTLPFTPAQIVIAKLISVAVLPIIICVGLAVPASIGFFTRTEGLSALFIPSILIGALVLAIYVVSITAILLMIIMRVFRFIRSRNFISIVTALLMFALSAAYITFSMGDSQLDESHAIGFFITISGVMSQMTVGFPSIDLTMKAASGAPIYLLYILGIAVASMILVSLFAKAFYFKAALGMTDANGVRGPVSEKTMRKNTVKISPAKALSRREVRNILRTPALITNGYLYSILFPLFIVGGMLIKLVDEFKQNVPPQQGGSILDAARDLLRYLNIPAPYFLIGCSLVCMLMAGFAVVLSSLSRFIISREGKDFATLKAMPVTATQLVIVKRNIALLFNGISGFFIPALMLIAAGILGFIPLWICAVCVAGNFAWLLAMVDFCAIKDVTGPNLNWDNEASVTKSNSYGLIILGVVIALLVLSVVLIVNVTEKDPSLLTVQSWVTAVLPFVAALIFEITLRRAASRLY